jgi:VWFA-related protein
MERWAMCPRERVTTGQTATALFVGAGVLAAAMTSASQAPPTFPAGVELVRIDVVVLDHDGLPVTGLTAADFEISEGGRLHEIASFEPIVVRSAPTPARVEPPAPPPVSESIVPTLAESRYVLIFFDDVHVSGPATERVRAQLSRFLERETRAGDWVTIVSPLSGLKWTARTAFERDQLPAVIRSLKGQLVRKLRKDDPGEFDAMQTSEYGGREPMESRGPNSQFTGNRYLLAEEVYAVAKRRVRRSLAGLSEAILSMSEFRGRKSLIFYSEGFIKSPGMPDYDRTIELALRARVAVYFVDPRGLGTGLSMFDGDDGGPTLITLDTEAGGTSYVATATGGRTSISNDVTALLRDAIVESSAYYLLGFHPSTAEPGERKLKVRVRREGVTVRAPDRYIAGKPATSSKPVPPAVQALGLVSDATDIPLRVSTLFLDASAKGDVTTTVAVELEKVASVNGQRRLDLIIEARPLDHTEPVRDTAELSIPAGGGAAVATRELHLRPGIWQARIVVRDARTEKLGSVLHTFEVPGGAGLRLSSPILTDEMEASRVPRPRLRLDRHYRSGSALYCQYRVFGAAVDATSGKPRVRASYAIARDGQVIQAGPPSTIEPTNDGQLLRLLGFGLAGFEPGEYTLVLHIADEVSGASREVKEPFTIVPAQS